MAQKLPEAGLAVDQRHAVEVLFERRVVGTYVADLIVNDAVVLTLKTANALNPAHVAQCLNFLKASRRGKPACC